MPAHSPNAHRRRTLGLVALAAAGLVAALLLLTGDLPPAAEPVSADHHVPPGAAPTLEGPGRSAATDPRSAGSHASPAPETVRIVGTVLGPGYAPRAGARVRVRSTERAALETTTDDAGRFDVPFGGRPATQAGVAVVAEAGDLAGVLSTWVDPVGEEVVDVGAVLLRPSFEFTVRVLRDGTPVPGARVWAGVVPLGGAGRFPMHHPFRSAWKWSHEATSDDGGLANFAKIPSGAVRLLAVADGPLRGEVVVRTDRLEPPIGLELSPARALRVEVVDERDVGIRGCLVDSLDLEDPWPPATTDEDGVARLPFLPREDVTIRAIAPSPRLTHRLPTPVAQAQDEVCRLKAQPVRSALLPFEVAEGPVPEEGTRVELRGEGFWWWPGDGHTLPPDAVVRAGMLLEVESPNASTGVARLPDGRVGAIDMDVRGSARRPGKPVVFHRPRRLAVTAMDRSGDPVSGVRLAIALRHRSPRWNRPAYVRVATTDAAGAAVFEGLTSGEGCLWVLEPALGPAHVAAALSPRESEPECVAVDLRDGDVDMSVEVSARNEGVIDVTLDGAAGIPKGLFVELMGGLWLIPRPAPGLRVDREESTIHFRARLPLASRKFRTLWARITSDDYADCTVTLDPDPDRGVMAARADLVRSGSLRVRLPAFLSPREVDLLAESWQGELLLPLVATVGDEGDLVYAGLRPGRYYLHVPGLGWDSPIFDVERGPDETVFVWGREATWAEGSVVVPPGTTLARVHIQAVDAESGQGIRTANLDGTSFRILIPGDRAVVLRADGPGLQPSAEEGEITLTRPRKGLVLRLEPAE